MTSRHYRREVQDIGYGMALVQLTKGEVAIVDAEDAERVANHNWYALVSSSSAQPKRTVYAASRTGSKIELLHRFVLRAGQDECIDHINGHGWDCRKANLRIATRSQNLANMRKPAGPSTSRFKGVSRHSQLPKWVATIAVKRKTKYLGIFDSEVDAAAAYNKAARELHGEFAWLNDLDGAA